MSILKQQRIILTGATGGIGTELCKQLAEHDCQLGLVGRSIEKLQQLSNSLASNTQYCLIVADISTAEGRQQIVDDMEDNFAGYDMLINTAGIMDFTSFLDQSDERIEAVLRTNVIAPMQLCKKVLPAMIKQQRGHIVNIGSTFGSIGFAWFTSYSTSKFALRGFSQSLRRELADTPINISYIAPRAVKTSLNSNAVYKMADAVKMNMDEPKKVASEIIKGIINNSKEKYIGFPEALFVRINAVFPGIIDMATRSQNNAAKKFIG